MDFIFVITPKQIMDYFQSMSEVIECIEKPKTHLEIGKKIELS